MSRTTKSAGTRREFLKNTGRVAAVSALGGLGRAARPRRRAEHPPARPGDRLRRPRHRAAADAMSAKGGPGNSQLVAIADAFQDRLKGSYGHIKRQFADKVDVPQERQFVGFDAYQKAMDCLKPGDIAIFATPLAFRWVNFAYAIQKGLHVFMEKPGSRPTARRPARSSSSPKRPPRRTSR